MNASINHIEELLSLVGELLHEFTPDHDWPNTHAAAMSKMHNYGYVEPTASKICFSNTHPLHWYNISEAESECPGCGENPSIKFYYLSLSEKIDKWMR